jgi:hypothetical protein
MKCIHSLKKMANVRKIHFDANSLFDENYSLNEQDHLKSIFTLFEKQIFF